MEIQPQTAAAGSRSNGDMAQNIQQLNQAGFDEAQVRALVAFVGDTVRNAVLPVMEHVDRRFDHMGQHFDDFGKRVDQRFDAADQRFGDFRKHVDQRFDAADQRFDDFRKYADHRFNELDRRADRVGARLDNLEQRTGGLGQSLARLDARIEAVQRREWVALTVMGLGFLGVIVAISVAAWMAISAG